jgi:hypothetical protein
VAAVPGNLRRSAYDVAVRYLLRPFNLWWRHFPQLAALYLLGWLGRKGATELAAYVGSGTTTSGPR